MAGSCEVWVGEERTRPSSRRRNCGREAAGLATKQPQPVGQSLPALPGPRAPPSSDPAAAPRTAKASQMFSPQREFHSGLQCVCVRACVYVHACPGMSQDTCVGPWGHMSVFTCLLVCLASLVFLCVRVYLGFCAPLCVSVCITGVCRCLCVPLYGFHVSQCKKMAFWSFYEHVTMCPHGCVHGYIHVFMGVTLCLYVLVGPRGSGAGAQLYLGQRGKGVTGTQSPSGSGQPASLPPPPGWPPSTSGHEAGQEP